MDFSKAFGTVNHYILLTKLNYNGINGKKYLDWSQSYITGFEQCTACNFDNASSYNEIIWGVHQGSIFRRLLFLICINDLFKVSSKLTTIMFADDSN